MKRKVKFGIIPITFLILSSLSCTSVYESVYPTLVDGKYDSEFPYKSSSKQLEDISNSIKLINSIAFYRSYIFDSSTAYHL